MGTWSPVLWALGRPVQRRARGICGGVQHSRTLPGEAGMLLTRYAFSYPANAAGAWCQMTAPDNGMGEVTQTCQAGLFLFLQGAPACSSLRQGVLQAESCM